MHAAVAELPLPAATAAAAGHQRHAAAPRQHPVRMARQRGPAGRPAAADAAESGVADRAVMALGDSITAGFAMKPAPLEYRGSVYCTGGDEGAKTIANFLRSTYRWPRRRRRRTVHHPLIDAAAPGWRASARARRCR